MNIILLIVIIVNKDVVLIPNPEVAFLVSVGGVNVFANNVIPNPVLIVTANRVI